MVETDYTKQLKIDNMNLETEIEKQQNETNKYDRLNYYYSQDEVMNVYVQKILTILYLIIYLSFVYFIYSNHDKYGTFSSIVYILIFTVLPFTIQFISRFLYKTFLQILHIFNTGNSAYLYITP